VSAIDPQKIASGNRRGGRRRWTAWVQLTPAVAFFGAFFLAPLAILVLYSFYTYSNYDFTPDYTLENYREAITSDVFRTYFIRTLEVALIVAGTVIVLSYPLCYVMTFVFRTRTQILYFLVLVSLFGGYLVRIYAWRTLLGADGLINDALISTGIVDKPVKAFLNSNFALILTMVNFYLPLGVLPIFAAMQNVSPGLLEAGRDLGSGTLHVTRRVMLPLTLRGVLAGFAFTAAEWVTPLLVGGTGDQLIGNQIAYQFNTAVDWPLGAALALTLIAFLIVFVGLVMGLLRVLTR
jgi:spermidine/putrescine transport system permease protein